MVPLTSPTPANQGRPSICSLRSSFRDGESFNDLLPSRHSLMKSSRNLCDLSDTDSEQEEDDEREDPEIEFIDDLEERLTIRGSMMSSAQEEGAEQPSQPRQPLKIQLLSLDDEESCIELKNARLQENWAANDLLLVLLMLVLPVSAICAINAWLWM
mmetsp:Transcript_11337/g.16651  ORF Transcript_11337/g.16651 Transcript_11337/m.16651 type:complete len:157 (-) Transcript_11337:104-574(-)